METILQTLTGSTMMPFIEQTLITISNNRSGYEVSPATWTKWTKMWNKRQVKELWDEIGNHRAIVLLQANAHFEQIRKDYLARLIEAEGSLEQLAQAIERDPTLSVVNADTEMADKLLASPGVLLIKQLGDIVLMRERDEYNLGPFQIVLHIERRQMRALALEPVYSYRSRMYFHPHVNGSGEICFGEVRSAYSAAQERKDYLSMMDIAESVVRNYFEPGAYVKLIDWYPPECKTCRSKPAHACQGCGTPRCDEHSTRCEKCGAERCESCEPECKICGTSTCQCGMVKCSASGAAICKDCMVTCKDCPATLSPEKADKCSCGAYLCSFCGTTCDTCDKVFCADCESKLAVTGGSGDEETHICPECQAKA